ARADYEGAFSIATSEGAYALRDRMKDFKVFLETDSICFAGVAIGDSNLLESFRDIDTNCRVTGSEKSGLGSH
ncbi:MAG: hypothetical protein M3R00_04890, partial [Pseudomonadota bacterium]|nr:hypothetical protein [Pseudomonadota bacterium]